MKSSPQNIMTIMGSNHRTNSTKHTPLFKFDMFKLKLKSKEPNSKFTYRATLKQQFKLNERPIYFTPIVL